MIRYRVRPERVAQNLELLEKVHAELQVTRPERLRYASFRLADGVSFVDLVETDGPGRFSELSSFREFRTGLEDRCEEPPVRSELHLVGSYDLG